MVAMSCSQSMSMQEKRRECFLRNDHHAQGIETTIGMALEDGLLDLKGFNFWNNRVVFFKEMVEEVWQMPVEEKMKRDKINTSAGGTWTHEGTNTHDDTTPQKEKGKLCPVGMLKRQKSCEFTTTEEEESAVSSQRKCVLKPNKMARQIPDVN